MNGLMTAVATAALFLGGAGVAVAAPENQALTPWECHRGGGFVVDAPQDWSPDWGRCSGGKHNRVPVYRGK